MIDPIEAHLFFLLQQTTSVTPEELCWWDSGRAEQVLAKARMHQHAPGQWTTTPSTAAWFEDAWLDIRGVPRPDVMPEPQEVQLGDQKLTGGWRRRQFIALVERTA
jgi:hypothetical protein